nr:uncharacterized protein LOC104091812 [Nicotiana tomentosiformis]
MVNGSPCGYFGSSRGLRQGDPLPPMLFILVMDALSKMMDRAAGGGFLRGFAAPIVVLSAGRVSRLLFANDTLVFCDQLTYLKQVLQWFQIVSGLKINLGKCEIFPVGEVANIDALSYLLRSKVGSLPTTYMCLPLGASHKDNTTVTSPKKWGGLGAKDLRVFNRVLLGKWLWRFKVEEHALWREVIVEKYDSTGGGWRTKAITAPFGWHVEGHHEELRSLQWQHHLQGGRWKENQLLESQVVWRGYSEGLFPHVFRVSNQKELMV